MSQRTIVVVGGTRGIGLEIARAIVARGDRVVLTGRDPGRAADTAASLGTDAVGLALDLAEPGTIAESLAPVGDVQGLVLCGVERDSNTARDFAIDRATRLATLKLVGYVETVHVLLDRLVPSVDTGVVLFGGVARHRPYPGSLTVSTTNGGVEGMVTALAFELAPIRVNVLHPGIIGDSPFWAEKTAALEGYRARTPGGELATVKDVAEATLFLLENRGVSAAALHVNRGTLIA
jgi:NAD(P)-dependent dehydrogenase (short-subunit alcohol dehydrogenase family)